MCSEPASRLVVAFGKPSVTCSYHFVNFGTLNLVVVFDSSVTGIDEL